MFVSDARIKVNEARLGNRLNGDYLIDEESSFLGISFTFKMILTIFLNYN